MTKCVCVREEGRGLEFIIHGDGICQWRSTTIKIGRGGNLSLMHCTVYMQHRMVILMYVLFLAAVVDVRGCV